MGRWLLVRYDADDPSEDVRKSAMFALSHIPRLTMTVGYDARFSSGHFGVWVATPPPSLHPSSSRSTPTRRS